MVATRTAVSVTLLMATIALTLSIVAIVSTRSGGEDVGMLVQTDLTNEYTGPALSFPLHDFYMGPDSEGRIRAFYRYPPSYFGRVRGCPIVWDHDATYEAADGHVAGPGVYVDPCGGARFDRDGYWLGGPADRGLDYFETMPEVQGFVVDTRTLYCGAPRSDAPTPTPDDAGPAGTPTPKTCERVSANGD